MINDSSTLMLDEQCERLQRDANALGVMVSNEDGLLGHSGLLGRLPDSILDAAADLIANVLAASNRSEIQDGDDLVAQVDPLSACAAPLGPKAALVVIFDEHSSLALVRLRMKRARDSLLRSLTEP